MEPQRIVILPGNEAARREQGQAKLMRWVFLIGGAALALTLLSLLVVVAAGVLTIAVPVAIGAALIGWIGMKLRRRS